MFLLIEMDVFRGFASSIRRARLRAISFDTMWMLCVICCMCYIYLWEYMLCIVCVCMNIKVGGCLF